MRLKINGVDHDLQIEPRVSLLDAIREYAGISGPKLGCNQGACGACTVLIDGTERIISCLALAVQYEGREITTIEGLADENGELHPLRRLRRNLRSRPRSLCSSRVNSSPPSSYRR